MFRWHDGCGAKLLEAYDRVLKLAGVRYDKTIHFYLMQATGGDTVDHDHEYDYVEWVPAEEALRRIAYPNEARLVERALALLPVQPGSTGLARRGG